MLGRDQTRSSSFEFSSETPPLARVGGEAQEITSEGPSTSEAPKGRQNIARDADRFSRTNSSSSIAAEQPQKSETGTAKFFKMTWSPPFVSFNTSFVSVNATTTEKREKEAEERMLEALVRWVPFTGYYTVNEVRTSIRSLLRRSWGTNPVGHMLKIEGARLDRAFFPLQEYCADENRQTISDLQPLRICGDLQQLMPSSGEAFDTGAMLVVTIERIMNVLTKRSHIHWKYTRLVQFNMSIVRGTYNSRARSQIQDLQLSVQGKRDETESLLWTTEMTILGSILSLWLFSIELRRSAAMKLDSNSLTLQG
jgi:hypothetical protein